MDWELGATKFPENWIHSSDTELASTPNFSLFSAVCSLYCRKPRTLSMQLPLLNSSAVMETPGISCAHIIKVVLEKVSNWGKFWKSSSHPNPEERNISTNNSFKKSGKFWQTTQNCWCLKWGAQGDDSCPWLWQKRAWVMQLRQQQGKGTAEG